MATCKHCGAEIEWAITAKNGRRIPLDPTPSERGNLIGCGTAEGGRTIVVRKIDLGDPAARVPHMATCPNYPKKPLQ